MTIRTVSLKTKFSLLTFLAPGAVTVSMLFSSTGLAELPFPTEKDLPHAFLVNETRQPDQIVMEHLTQRQQQSSVSMKDWLPGDFMDAAKRYEEEGRLLPYLEIEAMKRAGIPNLIARHD